MHYDSLPKLIRNDESLRSRSIAGARPKESVDAVSIVVKVDDQKRVGIDCVYIAADLMVIGVEFVYELPPIRPVLVILAVDWTAIRRRQRKKKREQNYLKVKTRSNQVPAKLMTLNSFQSLADEFLAQLDAEKNVQVAPDTESSEDSFICAKHSDRDRWRHGVKESRSRKEKARNGLFTWISYTYA